MTNTREEVAVTEAILEVSDGYMSNPNIAKAAIAASNSQYIPQLVAALKRIAESEYDYETGQHSNEIAQEALNNLPEELKQ